MLSPSSTLTNEYMTETTVFTTQAAGDWLHEAIPGESPEYWRQALINNRRADRTPPHRVPFSTMGRAAVYSPEALRDFAEFEKSRRIGQLKLTGRAAEVLQAFGIGQDGGAYGRNWRGGGANQVITNSGECFVQVRIDAPLIVFAMTPGQAIEFGKELVEVGQAAQRQNAERKSSQDLTGYKTVSDTPDMLIMKKD